MGFVLRRSMPSIAGLLGLLLAVGFAVVFVLGAPMWFPMAFAIGMIGLQYLLNPFLIEWLIPAARIDHADGRYLTDDRVGAMVARRCRDAGVPLVRLGIVDDGTPNAFTFGRTPRDARMWISRGLLERLDDDELDAVVAHEVGHVKHWDFAVMTVAAVVPMALYLLYVVARSTNRTEGRGVAVGAYLAYLVSQFVLLALSRAREYGADHWSCECTGHGDALASALVKVAYGMGRVDAERKAEAAALVESGRKGKRQAAKLQRRYQRTQSMRAMGIFDPRQVEALEAAFDAGIDPERAVAALRWDTVNPWGATLEKLSSHPLVARRIAALERSGLPGAPHHWSVLRASATATRAERLVLRRMWAKELVIAVAPWVVLIGMSGFGLFEGSATTAGIAVMLAGGLLLAKQVLRYPTTKAADVEEVAGLLERLDASPVAGIPVRIRGQVIGRGMPGYVLSPELVVQDGSGFVPLLYRQPIPFARAWFGLARVHQFMGTDVVARGWYRRMPGPVLELRDVQSSTGLSTRCWEWVARYAASAVVLLAGVLITLVAATV